MREVIALKALLLLALLLLVIVVPVVSAHECECSFESGREFGQHVSEHAQTGHFSGEMNPGHHQGFSPWAP